MRRVVMLCAGAAVLAGLAACRASSTAEPPAGTLVTAQTAASAALAAVALEPGDWPRFRGPAGNGLSTETGLNKNWSAKPPKVLWTAPLTDGGYSGPSVAGGMVYIIDHQGDQDIVKALDFKTGAPVWQYRYADTSSANYGFARATPTFDDGHLYTLSRLGLLICFDAASGKVVWQHDVCKEFGGRRPGWDLAGSPIIDGDKVVVMTGSANGTVLALNKLTGAAVWQGGGTEKPGYSTPVIATINGRKQYVMMTENSVIGVSAANGARLWSYPFVTNVGVNAASPVVFGNHVFIAAGYGHGCAMVEVGPTGPRLLWENKEIQAHFNTAVYANGFIYGVGDPGNLVCLNAATGAPAWKQGGFEKGGVLSADGTLLAMCGGSGEMVQVQLDPSGYKELGRVTPLGGQSWAPPVLAHGKAFVRNAKALACVDLK